MCLYIIDTAESKCTRKDEPLTLNYDVQSWDCDAVDHVNARDKDRARPATGAARDLAEVFRHYVCEADETTAGHIPEEARRLLSPLGETQARELRALLLQRLNR